MSRTEIWTERLLLRAVEETDLDAFTKWFTDPEAMKYWSTAPHTDIKQTKDFIDATIAGQYNGVLDFAVCLPDPQSEADQDREGSSMPVIGRAGIWDGKEIGFIFNREYWGKGYAFEALDALLKQFWAIHEEDPDASVKADVDPRNDASLRLLKRLGFVVIGSAKNTFETHLGWCDSIYLEVRRPTN
ncbi:putative N-acetyltransferase p20 [Psilocybe cubensis]|uniref:N-acetyltransferase domain-containing protein n=2 Tax=Psilocybe cubensis TaxID=181762 RepID=A0A8H7XSQ6_PSICU|nr:putative N-acetyltransferase p20 [Psilocybe cubensis]KAH9479123.1 putative N-acetyltransferase p20 [Psilocybe cubensis]